MWPNNSIISIHKILSAAFARLCLLFCGPKRPPPWAPCRVYFTPPHTQLHWQYPRARGTLSVCREGSSRFACVHQGIGFLATDLSLLFSNISDQDQRTQTWIFHWAALYRTIWPMVELGSVRIFHQRLSLVRIYGLGLLWHQKQVITT